MDGLAPPPPLLEAPAPPDRCALAAAEPETPAPRPYPSVGEILARVSPPLTAEGAEHVRRAYEIAERLHAKQRRKSGEPYFVHCAAVAMLLAELVSDWPTLAAGLLHDVIEDCGVTAKQLAEWMPAPVPELVEGVTKLSKLNFGSDREHQAENLRKMILAMARDVRVVLIKLCDRQHNMRTIQALTAERQKAIAQSTLEIFAPLAKRLGIQRISADLENLAMGVLHPVVFQKLRAHLDRNDERYSGIIRESKAVLEARLDAAGIQARVLGRIKHIYSIYRKMVANGLRFDEVHDLIAIRIITGNLGQAYEALGIVHSVWQPVAGRFKDYIARPKPNGYQSLHTTVIGVEGEIIEVQIRTAAMHATAEDGIAAHWKYKEGGGPRSPEAQEAQKLAWLRQLVDWLSDIRDPGEFMAAVKQNVYGASVFCYTPRGDVIDTPKGSTVLDFAYRVHTEVGQQCAGGRVNHKMTSIRTELKTGDIVEIVTSPKAHPTPDWLQIAHSTRAKNKIRHWLKTNNRDFYLERGRSLLWESLKARGNGAHLHEAEARLDAAAPSFHLATGEDVLIELGFGTIRASQVCARVQPEIPPPSPRRSAGAGSAASPGDNIVVDGLPGNLARLAQCCAPAPGEPVVGFVTKGRGISVHRADCPSLVHNRWLKEGGAKRFVPVSWSDGKPAILYATVRAICQDRTGLLVDLSQAVTQMGINIIGANTASDLRKGHATIKLVVQTADEAQLNALLSRLESVPSVLNLRRQIHRGGPPPSRTDSDSAARPAKTTKTKSKPGGPPESAAGSSN